jgi:predicted nucleotidyltransferase
MESSMFSIPQEKIAEFCRRRKITELALFGSVLHDNFRPDSDVDVLVTFAPDTRYSLFDLVSIQDELKVILGREVDLVEKAGLRNPFRRHHILKNFKVVYAA